MDVKSLMRRNNSYDGNEKSIAPNPNLNKKINNLRNTVSSLETSFKISKDLEDIKSSRFKMIKLSNERLKDNLEESEKRNTNMLSLYITYSYFYVL